MRTMKLVSSSLLVGSALYAIACGSSGPTDGSSSAPDLSTAQKAPPGSPQTLIHSATLEPGHTLDFYELPNNQSAVAETMETGQTSALSNVTGTQSLAEIHKAVLPGLEVPAAILAADERLATAARLATKAAVSPPTTGFEDSAGPGPRFYTAGQQAAFKAAHCHDTGTTSLDSCVQGFDWASVGWKYGGFFQSYTTLGSEAPQAATYQVYCWNGSQYLCWQGFVNPGWTVNVWFPGGGFTDHNFYYNWAQIINGGANHTVSLAALDCGNPGQRSCAAVCGASEPCTPAAWGCQIDGTTNGTCWAG